MSEILEKISKIREEHKEIGIKKKINAITEREEIIDGEVTKKEVIKTYTLDKEEDYIKVYIKHIMYLNNLPQGLHPLIYQLVKYVTYGNQIVLTAGIKRKIASDMGMSVHTINAYISSLVKKDILIRVDRAMYILNPVIFGKGNWSEIVKLREALEIHVVYDEQGIHFVHIGKKKEE